jgi:hypothetical protein
MTYFAKIMGGLLPAFSVLGVISLLAGALAVLAHVQTRFYQAKQLHSKEVPP